MAKTNDIFRDPRYVDFVKRYRADPLKFAIVATGFKPSIDQANLLRAIAPPNAKVSVVSGTGTGKTFTFARIALWHLLCFPSAVYDGKTEIGSNTYIGAPNIQQVADGIWKELNDAHMAMFNGAESWIADYIEITKTKVFIKGYESQWFISQIAFQKGKAVGVAGKHRYWQLIIIDEAAGVSDEHFNVIDGTQTQVGNRTLMASQGVRNSGRFYDSHHALAKKNGGSWDSLIFSSLASPFVTDSWLKDRLVECGGANTPEYRIRVLGEFVQDSSKYLLTRQDIDRAFEPRSIIGKDEPYGYLVLCDVAAGEYRDDSVVVVARVIGDGDGEDVSPRRVEVVSIPISDNGLDVVDMAGMVREIIGGLSYPTVMVDAGGVGSGVIRLLEREGIPVIKVNWGAPCFKKKYKDRFYNQRAGAMVCLRNAIREGRLVITQELPPNIKQKFYDQATRLPFHYAENGSLRYVMESKKDMAKQGIKSPDIVDAIAFAFLERADYMPADEKFGGDKATEKEALEEAAQLFADL